MVQDDVKDRFSTNLMDIVNSLLLHNQATRLGANGVEEIKAHPWFDCIDWKAMSCKEPVPPFLPLVYLRE